MLIQLKTYNETELGVERCSFRSFVSGAYLKATLTRNSLEKRRPFIAGNLGAWKPWPVTCEAEPNNLEPISHFYFQNTYVLMS